MSAEETQISWNLFSTNARTKCIRLWTGIINWIKGSLTNSSLWVCFLIGQSLLFCVYTITCNWSLTTSVCFCKNVCLSEHKTESPVLALVFIHCSKRLCTMFVIAPNENTIIALALLLNKEALGDYIRKVLWDIRSIQHSTLKASVWVRCASVDYTGGYDD